ncbi:MAG: HTTM domain-containing protein, partial [Acidimicrobiales bacterium]
MRPDRDAPHRGERLASTVRHAARDRFPRWADRVAGAAGRRVDARSVAVVRIVVGLGLAWSMSRYLWRGWVTTQLTAPEFHVTYPGLWWVRPLPAPWMHLVLVVTAIAGIALALGWRQRWSAALALVGFGWVESVDAATYLNHYELVTLMLALCVALPMSDAWSLDRRAGRRVSGTGERAGRGTVAVGVVWALRAQLGVVYLFAALAKLQSDWLVHGEPLTTWLAARTDVPLIGGLSIHPSAGLALSWAGAAFDLLVVPALLWKRTRAAAYVAVVVFHLVTGLLFPRIGVFPWLMIALTPIFFAPDWPGRALGRFRRITRAPIGPDPHAPTSTDARPV